MVYTDYGTQDNESYGIMILAYDILHDEFNKKDLECDIVFDICTDIIRKFLKSEEFNNFGWSFYDALQNFVMTNYMGVIYDEYER